MSKIDQIDYKQLSIDDWICETQEKLIAFTEYWKLMQGESKHFPRAMLRGDWDEQFILFEQGEQFTSLNKYD